MLHLFAVEKALDDLKPPMEANEVAEHLLPWLNDLRLSQNAIDTILSLPPRNTMLENARSVCIECRSLYGVFEQLSLCPQIEVAADSSHANVP